MKLTAEEFIKTHWDNCIRNNTEDDGTLIGLPYPYVVPSEEAFNELYYWDTYFTNRGLILSGRVELAKSNTDNILYLVEKLGFMPNGNRTFYLRQSQPPFLSLMVREIYEQFGDNEWLGKAYVTLCKEYKFWMTYRISEIGLNHYDAGNTPAYATPLENDMDCIAVDALMRRNQYIPHEDEAVLKRHYLTTCESGWDVNPRWEHCAYDYVHIELNSLLYALEKNMEYFAQILGNGDASQWCERAATRKALMLKYMVDENGLFTDYNVKTGEHSKIFSAAALYPFFVGLADKVHIKAISENLCRIEAEYGIVACEKNDFPGRYQWNYPNSWACLQSIAINALDRYGLGEDALRIAKKYIVLVEKVFDEKGVLLEKFNAVDYKEPPVTESANNKTPSMLGWSAGAYLEAKEYVKKHI